MTRALLLAAALLTPLPAQADPVDAAALIAARKYVCDYPDFDASEAALAAVVADGIPEDIAVEIISDLAWRIAASIEPAERGDFCGVMAAGVMARKPIRPADDADFVVAGR